MINEFIPYSFDKKQNPCIIDRSSNECQKEGQKSAQISLNYKPACWYCIRVYNLRHFFKVLSLFLSDDGNAFIPNQIEELLLLLIFVFLGRCELCKCFKVGIINSLWYFAFDVDPLSFHFGVIQAPYSQHLHLFFEQCLWRGICFVHTEDLLIFGFIESSMRGQYHLSMHIFLGCECDIFNMKGIPAIIPHKLDGCFNKKTGLKLNEGLQYRVLILGNIEISSL